MPFTLRTASAVLLCLSLTWATARGEESEPDYIHQLQTDAIENGSAPWGEWGIQPGKYSGWTSHSNRLIPVYTFGISLDKYKGENSLYRSAERITEIYDQVPEATLNPQAEYFDQTDIARLQRDAAAAGKKNIIVFVFDGMDWQTTWAAAIYNSGKVGYREGRGTGLHFLDYDGAETDYGYFVTSPHNNGTSVDVNAQTIINAGGQVPGGYDPARAGSTPWGRAPDPGYIIAQSKDRKHAYTDSASSATSLFAGIKTYNDAINVDAHGRKVAPVAHELQEQGRAIGVVTSVPISHATPGCAYSNNVTRADYQDITRDLLGLSSVANRQPLPGVDVLLGAGWGETKERDSGQGNNFVPGNTYITDADMAAVDVNNEGRYRVVQRTEGVNGGEALLNAAETAAANGERLFGYFGARFGNLPFQTANRDYNAPKGVRGVSGQYTEAEITENPTLAQMTEAALTVLSQNENGFWLMVEAGDVDWANHDNNIDNSIGAVLSGDDAFHVATQWVEKHSSWDETALILTADHGHYLILFEPEAIIPPAETADAQ